MADDFGTQLRRQREQRGISLEEITNITKIHVRYLQALENNQYDDLPGEVFIKGFIRSYGRAIGANVNELLNIYDETVGRERIERRQKEEKEDESETRKQVFLVNALVGGFLGLFFLFAVYWLVANPPKTETPEDARKALPSASKPAPENPGPPGTLNLDSESPGSEAGENESIQESPARDDTGSDPAPTVKEEPPPSEEKNKNISEKPVAEPGEAEKPVLETENSAIMTNQKAQQVQEDTTTPAEKPEAEAPLNLVIQVTENAWFNLSIDGSDKRDFILPAGETKELKAQEGFLLTIGNRRGTRLKLNGKDLELPTSSDNVVRKFQVNAKSIE